MDMIALAFRDGGVGMVLRFPQFFRDGASTAGRTQIRDHFALHGVERRAGPKPPAVELSRQFDAMIVVDRMEVECRVLLVADDCVAGHAIVLPHGDRHERRHLSGRRWAGNGPTYRYWPVVSLSLLETRTDTTLARLMIMPLRPASRLYLACARTRPRRSTSAWAMAPNACSSSAKSLLSRETSSPPTG